MHPLSSSISSSCVSPRRRLARYILTRQAHGAATATIRIELAILAWPRRTASLLFVGGKLALRGT
jgi:hypothetical protein